MPTIKCNKCNKLTNTAVTNAYSYPPFGVATECYLTWDCDNKKWIKGCSYENANPYSKPLFEKMLKDS